jgi:hypothetical protein
MRLKKVTRHIHRIPRKPFSDEYWRQLAVKEFPARSTEYHAPLWKDGHFVKANFAGPGTHILERLNQEPISEVDRAAKIHDLEIGLQNPHGTTRFADERLLKSIYSSNDNVWNKTVVGLPIALKVAANYLIPGVESPSLFQTSSDRKPLKLYLYRQQFNKLMNNY